MAVVTVRSTRVGFAITAMITSARWRDCMPRNLLLSIIVCAERDVICYEHGEDGTAYCRGRSRQIAV